MLSIALVLMLAQPPTPMATRVTLSGKKPLETHVADLMQQANVVIDLDRAVKGMPATIDAKNDRFWSALERLAQSADHRLVISGASGRITLLKGGDERYRPTPSFVHEAFRISVKRTTARLDVETGQRFTEVQLEAVWENTFKAFYAESPVNSTTALRAPGQPLAIRDITSGKMPVTGQSVEWMIRFADVPRSVEKVSEIKGIVKFVGTTQLLRFAFPADTPKPLSQASVAATLHSMQKRGRIWTATIQFQYPKGGPEFESFQSFLLDNECWLQRTDGTKFKNSGFEVGTESKGVIPVQYHFQENPKNGFAIAELRGWQVVVRTPGAIIEAAAPFTLTDVPLP